MGVGTDQTVMLIVGVLLVLAGAAAVAWKAYELKKECLEKTKAVVVLVIGVLVVCFGGYLVVDNAGNDRQATFEASLQKQAQDMNSSLPKMLDENTRFDHVNVYGTQVNYENTVVTRSADELDREQFQNIMFRKLTRELCPKDGIMAMFRKGVEYRYNYRDKNGGLITSVIISSQTCRLR